MTKFCNHISAERNLHVLSIIIGIPTFVILKRDGEVITTQGRNAIGKDPEGMVRVIILLLIIYS